MAFIDGENGHNFFDDMGFDALIEAVFFCPIHKKDMHTHECLTDCSMFIAGEGCIMGVERILRLRKEE